MSLIGCRSTLCLFFSFLLLLLSTTTSTTLSAVSSLHRLLLQNNYSNDLDSMNSWLQGVSIPLPDALGVTLGEINVGFLSVSLQADFVDMYCTDIALDVIEITAGQEEELGSNNVNTTTLPVDLTLDNFNVTCFVGYRYSSLGGVVSGSGGVNVYTNRNKIHLQMTIYNNNMLPFNATVEDCNNNNNTIFLDIVDLQFTQRGIVTGLLTLLETQVTNVLENRVSDVFCESLLRFDDSTIAFFENIADFLEPYLNTTAVDPLRAEQDLNDSSSLINFESPRGSLAMAVDVLLEQGWILLGNNNNGDLLINSLVRQFFLDPDGSLLLLDNNNIVLLDDQNVLNIANSTLEVSSLRIMGLDSFTQLSPLTTLGKQTLQTTIAMETILMELEMQMTLVTLENNNDTLRVLKENITATFGLKNIVMDLTFLLAIDRNVLNNHSFCLSQLLRDIQITQLEMNQNTTLVPPTITSSNLQRVLSSVMNIAFELYDEALLRALPNIVRMQDLFAAVFDYGLFDCNNSTILDTVAMFLESYAADNDTTEQDPLLAESQLQSNVALVDFVSPQGALAVAVDFILEQGATFLGSRSTDDEELLINSLVRQFFLDRNGLFKLNLENIQTEFILSQKNNNNETMMMDISIRSVQIKGLDSFTELTPFESLGKQTLRTSFELLSLSLEMELQVDLKTTTTNTILSDDLKVTFGLENFSVDTMAFLLAIDQQQMESLLLGTFLDLDRILFCLFDLLYDVQLTQLEIRVGKIVKPILTSNTPGLQQVLTAGIDIVFEVLYQDTLLRTIPNIVQSTLRDLLTTTLNTLLDLSSCPRVNTNQLNAANFIDMRDLLLPPAEAAALGGLGTEPYGGLTSFLKSLLDKNVFAVDPLTGIPVVNRLIIRPLTAWQSGVRGTLSLSESLVNFTLDLDYGGDLNARILLQMLNVRLENVDTVVEPFVLLEAVRQHATTLNNTAALAFDDRPLRLATTFVFAMNRTNDHIFNKAELSVDLRQLQLLATVFVNAFEKAILTFPLRDLLTLECWLATVPTPTLDARGIRLEQNRSLGVTDLRLDVSDMNLNVACIDCTSPLLVEVTRLLQSSPRARRDASRMSRQIKNLVLDVARGDFSLLQVYLDRKAAHAPMKCPHHPDYDPNFTEPKAYAEPLTTLTPPDQKDALILLWSLLGVVVVLALAVVLVGWIVRRFVRRRHARWISTLDRDHVVSIYRAQTSEQASEHYVDANTDSLFASRSVLSVWVRWSVPIILVANIGLFLSGHLSIGGSVHIYISLAGDELIVRDFYTFSIAQSAVDLYKSGGTEVAVMILLFSGIWPYTKQLLTLALWCMPPTMVSAARRGNILRWLDALAKWSMLDVFAMIVSLVAFSLNITSPTHLGFLPEDMYKVDMLVEPLWGLYANMLAQLLSQFTSHVILACHARVVEKARSMNNLSPEDESMHVPPQEVESNTSTLPPQPVVPLSPSNGFKPMSSVTSRTASINSSMVSKRHAGDVPVAVAEEEEVEEEASTRLHEDANTHRLYEHGFARPHRGENDKLVVRRGVFGAVWICGFACAALVVTGCIVPSFILQLQGIVALAVEAGQVEAESEYGIFSIVSELHRQARFFGTAKLLVGMGSIMAVFLCTVLVVPLTLVVLLLVQWTASLSERTRQRISAAMEILQAWQYIEVYLIAVILSTWQLGKISDFLVNDYCGSLDRGFAMLVFYGLIDDGDAQCFRVQARLKEGTYILILSSLLLTFLYAFVVKANAQYERDCCGVARSSLPDKEEGNLSLSEMRNKIHPVPVLFSDQFRWVLQCQKPVPS